MKDTIPPEGAWGQRSSLDGENKSMYKQEDNVAHGISLICDYLLTAVYLKRDIEDLEGFLACGDKALGYSRRVLYEEELNLFYSTTSIHESAMERGHTRWLNFSFLYAFSLANEVPKRSTKKYNITRASELQAALFIFGERALHVGQQVSKKNRSFRANGYEARLHSPQSLLLQILAL